MNITAALKKHSIAGNIPEHAALTIAQQGDALISELVDILKRSEKQVGMVLGEDIARAIGKAEGFKFNEREYNFEKQKVE